MTTDNAHNWTKLLRYREVTRRGQSQEMAKDILLYYSIEEEQEKFDHRVGFCPW